MSETKWKQINSSGGEYRRIGSSLIVRAKPDVSTFLKAFMIVWETFWVFGCSIVTTEYLYGREAAEFAWNINISEKSADPAIWLLFAIPAAIYVGIIIMWLNFGVEQCSLSNKKLAHKVSVLGIGLSREYILTAILDTFLEKTTSFVRQKGSPIETRYNVCLTVDGTRIKLFSRQQRDVAKQLQASIIAYASQHGVKIKSYGAAEDGKS